MFRNREQAGLLLAKRLKAYKIINGVVLAIPRGGVPIGHVIAQQLHLPLDLIMSKKIGHPGHPEFAIGSVTLNDLVLDDIASKLPEAYIDDEVKRIRDDIQKRYNRFTKGKKPSMIEGKDVIVVDDGIATGNTMLACIESLRKQKPGSIIVAAPVSSTYAAERISEVVDHFVCLEVPQLFYAVGEFYEDFSEVPDEMVIDLLANNKPGALSSQHKYSF